VQALLNQNGKMNAKIRDALRVFKENQDAHDSVAPAVLAMLAPDFGRGHRFMIKNNK